MKFAQKFVSIRIVHVFRRRVQRVAKRREAVNTILVCHVHQIGVALHDIDDVEQIVVAGPSCILADAGLIDVGLLELELPHDGIGMNAGETAEQRRVGRHQRLQVGDDRVRVGRGRAGLEALTPPMEILARSLKIAPISAKGGVRRVRGGGAVGEGLRAPP